MSLTLYTDHYGAAKNGNILPDDGKSYPVTVIDPAGHIQIGEAVWLDNGIQFSYYSGTRIMEISYIKEKCEPKVDLLKRPGSFRPFLISKNPNFKEFEALLDKDCKTHEYFIIGSKIVHEPDRVERFSRELKLPDIIVPLDKKIKIVMGDVQSGKTWSIISLALSYKYDKRMTCFIVIRNSLDDLYQITTRFNDMTKDYFAKNPDDPIFVSLERGKEATEQKIYEAMEDAKPQIFIVMRSTTDIGPVNSMIEQRLFRRYVVIIDEVDDVFSSTDAKCLPCIQTLVDNSRLMWGFSATIMQTLMEKPITRDNVVILPPSAEYRGFNHVNFIKLPKDCKYSVHTPDNLFETDLNLQDYIKGFSKRKPFRNLKHPVIGIVKAGSAIEPNLKAAAYVNKHYSKKITTITYNGAGKYDPITIRGYTLPTNSIAVNNKHSRYIDGVHYIRDISIGDIMNWIRSQGYTRFPRVLIFAGKKADRGITFGGSDYTYGRPWHATEMYLVIPDNSTQATLLQAAGRLCGNHGDDIPLNCYSNGGDEICKAFNLNHELLYRGKLSSDPDSTYDKIIPQIEISRDKCLSRHMTAKKNPKLKKVLDDSIYKNAIDWVAEGRSAFIYDIPLSSGESVEMVRSVPSIQELKEIRVLAEKIRVERIRVKRQEERVDDTVVGNMKKIIDAYKRPDKGRIYFIIKKFRDMLFRDCTLKELHDTVKENTGDKLTIGNHTLWDLDHGKYLIVKHMGRNVYRLDDKVKELCQTGQLD